MTTKEYFKGIIDSLSEQHSRAIEQFTPHTSAFQEALDRAADAISKKMYIGVFTGSFVGALIYFVLEQNTDIGFWLRLFIGFCVFVGVAYYLTDRRYNDEAQKRISTLTDEQVCHDLWQLPGYREEVEDIFAKLRQLASLLDYMNMHARLIDRNGHPHPLLASVLYYLDQQSRPEPDNLYHIATINKTISYFSEYLDQAEADLKIHDRPMIPMIVDMPSGPAFMESYQRFMGYIFERVAYLHEKRDGIFSAAELQNLPENVVPLFGDRVSATDEEQTALEYDFYSLFQIVDPIFSQKGPILVGEEGFDQCLADAAECIDALSGQYEMNAPART